MQKKWTRLAAILAVAAAYWFVQAGNLEPPGPPGPTMKTLDQVEARVPLSNASFTIAAPGSYYLTEDITGASATGISINVDDVTLDLNGFSIVGASTPDVPGLSVSSASNVVLRSGSVRGFHSGVEVQGSSDVSLLGLRVLANDTVGVRVDTARVTIADCSVSENGGVGIDASAAAVGPFETAIVQHSSIVSNGSHGILVSSAYLIASDNTIFMNGGQGIDISMADGQLLNNTVTFNTGSGISTALISGAIVDNRCFGNGGFGLRVQLADPSNIVARNLASSNTSGDFDIDAVAAAGSVSTPAAAGAWDNIDSGP